MHDTDSLARVSHREPVVNHVRRELRRAILEGRLAPGERLIETSLAATMEVSRTPVREALFRLEAEGLVHRNRGGLVVGNTIASLTDVLLLRQRIEGLAGRLATERATDAELRVIVEAANIDPRDIETMSEAERARVDRTFHMSIAAACHSPRVTILLEELYEYSFRSAPISGFPNLTALQDQHRRIAAALADRNADWVEREIEHHLSSVLREIARGASKPASA